MHIEMVVGCLLVGDVKGSSFTVYVGGSEMNLIVNEKGSYFMTPEQISTRNAFVHFSRCIVN